MPLIPIPGVGAKGIVRDTEAVLLSPDTWSNGRNVRFDNGSVSKITGHSSMLSTSTEPLELLYWPRPVAPRYIYADETQIYQLLANNTSAVLNPTNTDGDPIAFSSTSSWQGSLFNGGYTVVMNNGIDAPQYITYGTSGNANETSFQPLPDWPSTLSAGVVRSFGSILIAGDLTDRSGSTVNFQPGTIRISSRAAPGFVPASWTVGPELLTTADEFELSAGGKVLEVVGLKNTAMVFTDNSIHLVRPATARGATQVDNLNYGKGVLAPKCAIELDGSVFVVDRNDIYVTTGSGSIDSVCDNRMRDYFFDVLHPTFYANTFVVRNLAYDEIWITYPTTASVDGTCDETLIWNYKDNTWSLRDMPSSVAGTVGPVTDGANYTAGADHIIFTGFEVASATSQRNIVASGEASNNTIAGSVAEFDWVLSGSSNTTAPSVVEVQRAVITGDIDGQVPAISEIQQATLTGSVTGVVEGDEEVQQIALTGSLSGFTPGEVAIQQASATGVLTGPVAGSAEVQSLAFSGSVAGPLAATPEVQTATVTGSLAGAVAGTTETQILRYSGTRSNVVLPGSVSPEIVTISLPNNFNSGTSSRVNSRGVTFASYDLTDLRTTSLEFGDLTLGILFSLTGSINSSLIGGGASSYDSFLGTTFDSFVTAAIGQTWGGVGGPVIAAYDTATHVMILEFPGFTSDVNTQGEFSFTLEIDVLSGILGTVESSFLTGTSGIATRDALIQPHEPTAAYSFDIDVDDTVFTGPALTGSFSTNIGATVALNVLASRVTSAFPSIVASAVTVGNTMTSISLDTNQLVDISQSLTITANFGINTEPMITAQHGGSAEDGAGTQSTYLVRDYAGTEVTAFTSSVDNAGGSDLNSVLSRINTAVNSNVETPIDFTSAINLGATRIDLTAVVPGSVSGVWSVDIVHSNTDDQLSGTISFRGAEISAGSDPVPAESVIITATSPTGVNSTIPVQADSDGFNASDIAGVIRSSTIAGWTLSGTGADVVLTSDTTGPVEGQFSFTENDPSVSITTVVTTEGAGVTPAETAFISITAPGATAPSAFVLTGPLDSSGVASQIAAVTFPGWTTSRSGSTVTYTNNLNGNQTGIFVFDPEESDVAAAQTTVAEGVADTPAERSVITITTDTDAVINVTIDGRVGGSNQAQIAEDFVNNAVIPGWTVTRSISTLTFTATETGEVSRVFTSVSDNSNARLSTFSFTGSSFAPENGSDDSARQSVAFDITSPEGTTRNVTVQAREAGSTTANIAEDLATLLSFPGWVVSSSAANTVLTSDTRRAVAGQFLVALTQAGGSNVTQTTSVTTEGSLDTPGESAVITITPPSGTPVETTLTADKDTLTASDIADALRAQTVIPGWVLSGVGTALTFASETTGEIDGDFMFTSTISRVTASISTIRAGAEITPQGSATFTITPPGGEAIVFSPVVPTSGLTNEEVVSAIRTNVNVPAWTLGGSGSTINFTANVGGAVTGSFTVDVVGDPTVVISTPTEGVDEIEASVATIVDDAGVTTLSLTLGSGLTGDQVGAALAAAFVMGAALTYNPTSNALTHTNLNIGQRARPILTFSNDSRNLTPLTTQNSGGNVSGSAPTSTPSIYTVTLPEGFSPNTVTYSSVDETLDQVITGIRNAINLPNIEPADIQAISSGNELTISWSGVSTNTLFSIAVDNQGGDGDVTFGTATIETPSATQSSAIHRGDNTTQFNGSNFEAFVERTTLDLGDLEIAKWVGALYPVANGSGSLTISVRGTTAAGEPVTFSSRDTRTFSIRDGYKVDPRKRGRFLNARFSSNDSNTWTLSSYSIEATQDDKR